jgi:hypothetical protein
MLGTTAANAQIDLSPEDAAVKAMPAVTYAKETLAAKVDDDSMYYVVDGGGTSLDLTAELGFAGGGGGTDDVIVVVKLEGMVFTDDSLDGPALSVGGGTAVSHSAGGEAGDDSVTYAVKRGAASTATTEVSLAIEDLGITSSGPGGITMTMTNVQQRALLTGIVDNPGVQAESYPGAIAVKSGVQETATSLTPYAIVSDSFMSFGAKDGPPSTPADLMESVGTFRIALAEGAAAFLNADDAEEIGAQGLDDLIDVGTPGADVADGASSVTFTGNFSFADMVWLDTDEECTGTVNDLLMRDDEGMVSDTKMLKPAPPADVADAMHLCIKARESTEEMPVRIPVTSRYVAMTTYKAAVTDGMAPGDGSEMLGMIRRDGTTVRLPYLTTNMKFNQRIYIVNRSDAETKYYFDFHGAGDIAGMDAEGMVGANSAMMLSLYLNDVVTVGEGRGSTSGTLIVEAQAAMIDVATVLTNREIGTTDTVVYEADD